MLSKGLFWQISNAAETSHVSTLFGTIHLPIQSQSILNRIDHFVEFYDYIYTETSLDPSVQKYVMPYVSVGHSEWEQRFSSRQLKRMISILDKSYQIEFGVVKHLRPMFIMSLIYGTLSSNGASQKVDEYIWNHAHRLNKNTDGIESIHRQVDILKAIPLDYEFRQFKSWVWNVSKMNRHFKKLIDHYYDESILTLYNSSRQSMSGVKSLMLDNRNISMADTIMESHLNHPGFFTFGAGHLAGASGILRLLKMRGFSVKPVQFD